MSQEKILEVQNNKLRKNLDKNRNKIRKRISSIEELIPFNVLIDLKQKLTSDSIVDEELHSVDTDVYETDIGELEDYGINFSVLAEGNLEEGVFINLEDIIDASIISELHRFITKDSGTDIETIEGLEEEYKENGLDMEDISMMTYTMIEKFTLSDIINYNALNILSILQNNISAMMSPNDEFDDLEDIIDSPDFLKNFGKFDDLEEEDFNGDVQMIGDTAMIAFKSEEESTLYTTPFDIDLSVETKEKMLKMQVSRFKFKNELVSNLYDLITSTRTPKMVTIIDNNENGMGDEQYDISAEGFIGYQMRHRYLFEQHIENMLNGEKLGTIMVREFLPFMKTVTRNKRTMELPYKNVFGYVVYEGEIMSIPEDDLKDSYSYDSRTGEPIELEEEVSYINKNIV